MSEEAVEIISGRPTACRTGVGLTSGRRLGGTALCQRCHLLQDRSHHFAQAADRTHAYRRWLAIGDLFLGPYQVLVAAISLKHGAVSFRSMLCRRMVETANCGVSRSSLRLTLVAHQRD
jgi:hypothetical protein